jgi:hypothetical protein
MTAAELVVATGGTLLRRSDRAVRGAAVDSRTVEPGQLFVALAGERTDGHRFLAHAAAAGASALLVARPPERDEPPLDALGDVTVVLVPDTLRALHAIAAAWRRRFDVLVVGITGSIAKTSTKEAVAAVLARRYVTLGTEGNQNNEVGLPLTVLRMGPEHEAAVLEMGMYAGGEIRDLAAIGRRRSASSPRSSRSTSARSARWTRSRTRRPSWSSAAAAEDGGRGDPQRRRRARAADGRPNAARVASYGVRPEPRSGRTASRHAGWTAGASGWSRRPATRR